MTKKAQRRNKLSEAASLAHDMKSFLSVIKVFLEKADVADEDMQVCQKAALRSLERVLRLVDGLVRTEEDNLAIRDIAGEIKDVVESLKSKAMENGINIRYSGPQSQLGLVDRAVAGRLVANLAVNAMEACDFGGEVRIELFARGSDIYIGVADNGCGIDERYLPIIFERGFTSGKINGTGIGLDTCRTIAEDHGGLIKVASKKGKGTAFTVSIPERVVPAQSLCDIGGRGRSIAEAIARDDTLD